MDKRKLDFSKVYEALSSDECAKKPPSKIRTIGFSKGILSLCFPSYFASENALFTDLDAIYIALKEEIGAAALFAGAEKIDSEEKALEIIEAIPSIKEALKKDAVAIYEGDPAATSAEEVMLTYPGFFAIALYRIAHEFYKRKIPILSRIITEYAHEKTGIDIHAGAKIGEYFFIDHGTGIVIGETTTIGNHVKIYQGVTLGAKSFELDENGNPVKGIKRHPDIGNGVIIYANATILGGNTKIGDGAVIGGNVWLTHSVEQNSVVYYDNKTKN